MKRTELNSLMKSCARTKAGIFSDEIARKRNDANSCLNLETCQYRIGDAALRGPYSKDLAMWSLCSDSGPFYFL